MHVQMSIDLTERDGRRLDVSQDSDPGVVKPCGDCSLCCKVLRINVLDKPSGHWCRHFAKGVGCAIHTETPVECRRFQCFWSISSKLGEEWRPDRSKLVLWSNAEERMIVDVDPAFPNAWRREPYYTELKAWSDRNRPRPLEVLVRTSGRMLVIFPETDVDLGVQQPDASIDSGYRVECGRKTPYAAYVQPHVARPHSPKPHSPRGGRAELANSRVRA